MSDAIRNAAERQAHWSKLPGLRLWAKWSRAPWQVKTFSAILDVGGKPVGEKWGWSNKALGGMGRFGGGWRWKLGLEGGTRSVNVYLIWAMLQITWGEDPNARRVREKAEAEARRARIAATVTPKPDDVPF